MYYLVVKRMDAGPGAHYLVAPFEYEDRQEARAIQRASEGSGIYVAIASNVSDVYGEYANHDEISLEELKAVLSGWGAQL